MAALPHILPATGGRFSPRWRRTRLALLLAGLAIQPAMLPAAPAGNAPNFFETVALKIARSPFDARWASVLSAPFKPSGEAGRVIAAAKSMAPRRRLEYVNIWVNKHVRYVPDSLAQGDHWQSAAATLRRGAGDCEDLALLKFKLLEAAGTDRRDVYLVVGRDVSVRADHALLVVRQDGEALALDNRSNILAPAKGKDLRPIFTFSQRQAWIHGYATEKRSAHLNAKGRDCRATPGGNGAPRNCPSSTSPG